MPKALHIALFICLATIANAQTVVNGYQRSQFTEYFSKTVVPLETAVKFLSDVYQVNFIYEHDLVINKKSPVLTNVSGNFYDDLIYTLDNHPIQFIKAGKKTIVLIAREKESAARRIIRGVVTDEDGKGISDAEVFIKGTSWGAVTLRDGSYFIDTVPEGKYTLTARCVGFRTERQEVEIRTAEALEIDFKLTIDVLNMDEVVTTASRNPLTKIESSVAITTANSAQIRERKPRSTADLLMYIPGFYVESSGGESGNNLFPRGIPQDGSYRYISMFEDGLPLFEASELAFANIDIMMRLDENIAQMEGVRGGTGSIYASNAPGGIINFVNKTGGEHNAGIVKFSIGDYGHYRLDYNMGGPLGDSWQYNIGGFLRQGDGIRDPGFAANKGGQMKLNLTRLFKNGYARIYGKYLNDRNIFYLPIPLKNPGNPQGIPGVNANYGTLTSVHMENVNLPTPDGRMIERDIRDGIHPELGSVTGELFLDLGQNWSLNYKSRWTKADIGFNAIFSLDTPVPAAVFADSIKRLSQLPGFGHWEYRYADSGERIENIESLNNNGLVTRSGWWSIQKPLENMINQLQVRKTFGKHLLDVTGYYSTYSAADFWYLHNVLIEINENPRMLDLAAFDSNGNELVSVTQNGFEQFGTFYVNAESEAAVTALAVVDEWQPHKKLRIDGGFRLEHARFNGKVENTRYDAGIPGSTALAGQHVTFGDGTFRNYDHTFNEWAVSLGVNYSLSSRLAIYGRAGRGFRTPDFEQWTISAERGESQYVQQMESGIKMVSDAVSLFGTVFFSRLDNIPFSDEVFRDGRIFKENRFASSTTLGTEIEAVWSISSSLSLYVNGTLQHPKLLDMRIKSVNADEGYVTVLDLSGKQVRRIPKMIWGFRPSYKFYNLKIFSEWQFIGKRYVDDSNTAELPAYHMFNAGMVFDIPNTGFTISGSVANVTNTIGLTEGNPRVDSVIANPRDEIFMARPILGRSIMLSAAYTF